MKINQNILPESEVYKTKVERLNEVKSKLVFANPSNEDLNIKTLADIIYYMTKSEQRFYTNWIRKNGVIYKQNTGACRSGEDIYLISKEYFPDITYTHIKEALGCLGLSNWYCPNVRRVVYSSSSFDIYKNKKWYNDRINEDNLNLYLDVN